MCIRDRSATWTPETQTLIVEFDSSKISLDKILKNLAEVGHDNEKYKTDDETYEALPECCHYDRKATFEEVIATKKAENTEETQDENQENTPKTDSVEENSMKMEMLENKNIHEKKIEEVKLTKAQEATALNGKSADLTFNIGKKELLKAACCNLSESFETNATVDVSFSNAVTGCLLYTSRCV